MGGETNLATLLKTMQPAVVAESFVFLTFNTMSLNDMVTLMPKATITEDEGITAVVPKHLADKQGYTYDSVFKCITLTVHSSLNAVGLTAAFANKLKQHGISANVIAGYYHDHIFVQADLVDEAVSALQEFSESQ